MEPIAIIGIGCRFPQAKNPQAFWEILKNGVDTITEVPSQRWDVEAFYEPQPATPGKMYTRWGGFLEQVDQFDPSFFKISAREAEHMDPQQRLVLEVAWEALENTGVVPKTLGGSQTGVFMGLTNADYHRLLYKNPSQISAYSATGTTPCIAANRLSYLLDLRSPSLTIDTACSSSLVAIHLACQSLHKGESNLCLAGGVNLMLVPEPTISCSQAQMMSPDGRCKTFDAGANGFVRGEGCGIIVLKRLQDAQRDGDNILALIRGSAVNQDGTTNGLTAPNGPSQQAVIRQALKQAGVTPAQISYVEAHGTGTSLGDPIEVKALKAVLMEGRSKDQPCWIGSVKTNIGHLEGAAGIAGLIKIVLQLQQKEIAPHLHFKQLNPYISLEGTPFAIPVEHQPWSCPGSRLAGVSSFSFGGTNCHIILEEAPSSLRLSDTGENPKSIDRHQHILTLSAKSASALVSLAQQYEDFFKSHQELSLADVCFCANTGRTHFQHRLAFVAESNEQLCQQLSAFVTSKNAGFLGCGEVTKLKPPKLAFLFTGQGSQYVGMGLQLYKQSPTFRQTLDHCDEILRPYLKQPLLEVLYPEEGQSSLLNETAYTQPALFALEYALFRLWESWGIKPDVVMGHSVGEYVAACVAGVFSLEDGLKLIAERARLMQALPQDGEMVALLTDFSQVTAALEPYAQSVAIAAANGPRSFVISGERQAIQAVCETLKAQRVKIKPLQVSHAFHSPLMQPMLEEFRQVVSSITFSPPQLKLVSNLTGQLATAEIATPEYWCQHIWDTVRFGISMKTLGQQGYEVFVEIGPKPILLGMGRQCLPEDKQLWWLPSLRSGQTDWQSMLESLAQLYLRGVSVDWQGFDGDYKRQRVVLPNYPFQRQRYWAEINNNANNGHSPKDIQTAIANLLHQEDTQNLTQYLEIAEELSAEEVKLLPKLLSVLMKQHQKHEKAARGDWLYEVKWQSSPRPLTQISLQEQGAWLILADRWGLGQALANLLDERGQTSLLVYAGDTFEEKEPGTWSVNPSNPDDFHRLLQEVAVNTQLPLKAVVHLWSLEAGLAPKLTTPALEQIQVTSCGSTLHLVQALLNHSGQVLPRLWLVTRGAVSVNSSVPGLAQASLWGLGKVIALEHPQLWGGLLDLAVDESTDEATNLLAEIIDSQGEDQIAWRQRQRYVARLVRREEKVAAVSLSSDCTYLITGGNGVLGLKVAQWMVKQGARHLLLTGRREASESALQAIAQMQQAGVEVLVVRADVANYQDMERTFQQVQQSMPPIRGIIHAAGVLDDGILSQLSWERFAKVIAPKVNGAWNLHLLTQQIPLDFFVCFSSVSSLLGSPGQGNYAAANAFMDALAHYRQSLGLPGLSINWGPWSDAGMAAALSNRDQARFAAQGIQSIPLEQGMQILGNLLGEQSIPQVGVLPVDWAKFLQKFPSEVSFFEHFGYTSEQPSTQQSEFLQQLKSATVTERRHLLVTHVRGTVAKVLGLGSPQQVDIQQGLLDLGMDSLMAVELKNNLQTSLKCSIPATLIFDYPTVEALGDYLAKEVIETELSSEEAGELETSNAQEQDVVESNLDDLSDSEAEALLLSKLDSMRY